MQFRTRALVTTFLSSTYTVFPNARIFDYSNRSIGNCQPLTAPFSRKKPKAPTISEDEAMACVGETTRIVRPLTGCEGLIRPTARSPGCHSAERPRRAERRSSRNEHWVPTPRSVVPKRVE